VEGNTNPGWFGYEAGVLLTLPAGTFGKKFCNSRIGLVYKFNEGAVSLVI
jgi:hypothetical protein